MAQLGNAISVRWTPLNPFAQWHTSCYQLAAPGQSAAAAPAHGSRVSCLACDSPNPVGAHVKLDQPQPKTAAPEISAALQRVRRAKVSRLLNGGLATGAVAALGLQGLAGCAAEDESSATQNQTEYSPNVPAPGKTQNNTEGQRNTDMVRYDGESWTEQSDCNSRAGCMTLDVILKVLVRPVAGANLDAKRVGVVFRLPSWEPGRTATAIGSYYTSNDGWEEWHVRVRRPNWDPTFVPIFTAWYKDGKNGVYYDDNQGEFHAVDGYHQAIYNRHWGDNATSVQVSSSGVTGTISVQLADLDWDKQVDLVWTTDDWATVGVYSLGEGQNAWHWMYDSYNGYDIFNIDLNIPGSASEFTYAVVYRHGVINGAEPYEFWANNGGYNFTVTSDGTHPL